MACDSRERAQDRFTTATDDIAVLLIDSEGPVSTRPIEENRHFMVQTMEAWFYADKDALKQYYGLTFSAAALSQRPDVETIPKSELIPGLKKAVKGEYLKGEDSFKLLALIDPAKVRAASSYADRLLKYLDTVCT